MVRYIILFVILLQLSPIHIYATHTDSWSKLDNISDQALQLVKNQKYDKARDLLNYFSDEFLKYRLEEHKVTMDQLRVITLSHQEALEAVTLSSLEAEERIRKLTKFRLLIDAIQAEHQPMWIQMNESIMSSFYNMQSTLEKGSFQDFQVAKNVFLKNFDTILPSLIVDLNPEEYTKLNSHVSFLEKYYSSELNKVEKRDHMSRFEKDLQALFKNKDLDDTDPSLIGVIISTGSVIFITLFYVGWRKYRGEKKQRKSRQKN